MVYEDHHWRVMRRGWFVGGKKAGFQADAAISVALTTCYPGVTAQEMATSPPPYAVYQCLTTVSEKKNS